MLDDREYMLVIFFVLVMCALAIGYEFGTVSTIARMQDYLRIRSRGTVHARDDPKEAETVEG